MAQCAAASTSGVCMGSSVGLEPGSSSDGDARWCIEIAERIGDGHKDAESQLNDRLRPGLMMLLRACCGRDRELAADLCQDTLVIVLQRLRSRTIEDPARLAAFAAQTARQLAFDARRRFASRNTIVDSDAAHAAAAESPDEPVAETAALAKLVQSVLAGLPKERDREVLRRFYLQDEDKTDICRALDLAPHAFDLLIFRARARMRTLLEARGLGLADFLSLVLPCMVYLCQL
jgi:RNA polymerase sigma-70 factor (ECF subfamily)